MPLSLTCLAETALERTLLAAAVQNDSRLYVPHGAVIGLDALSKGREMWEEVTITMKKPPRSIDFADSPDYARLIDLAAGDPLQRYRVEPVLDRQHPPLQ